MDQTCNRPGCTGKIVDGVCEDCGRAPLGGPSLVVQSVAKPPVSGVTGTVSSASSTLSGRTGTGSSRHSTRGSSGSTRRSLGAGLVRLEPLPSRDPLQSLMQNAVVPENKRFCPGCNTKLKYEKGFCPMCGAEYSFVPTLQPGDVVADQYEVKGPIAFGGLGWIYLGWDKTLSRWVVMKGLLNSKDAAGAQAAMAERQFLAAVKHPKIVGVYNFVTRGTEGYIVMEYVGGKTIKDIRKERGPLPPAEALAYMHGILPAFGYLERMGLIYCDFKPDNVMLEDDDVKLIDMGGVRRVDDMDGDVYGTKGYSAPEAGENPSFVTDLYTVGRTLAVLLLDFKFQGQYEFTLPPPAEQPVFGQYDSLYRFLLRATHQDPDQRFQTADEMSDQMLGVMREVVAISTNTPRPSESLHFFAESAEAQTEATSYRTLPALKLDALDPAANVILSSGGIRALDQRIALLERACAQFPESQEAFLRLALAQIEANRPAEAEKALAHAETQDAFDWRVWWYRGLLLLSREKPKEALAMFDRVYMEMPGEPMPKLARAIAAEQAGELKTAARFYDMVSRVDPNITTAVFGLARCLAKTGDRNGAVAAYGRIAGTSSRYVEAQLALTRTLLNAEPAAPGENELVRAAAALQALTLDNLDLHYLTAQLLLTAVHQVESRTLQADDSRQLLGCALQAASLRAGVEKALRACAHLVKTREEKIALIDQANHERPRTWV